MLIANANANCYFGLITTRFGGAGDPSAFLKVMGIWTSSALLFRLIRSTVLVPATPTHSVAPSGVRLPFKASVAPAGNVDGANAVSRFSSVSTLLMPAGKTAICVPAEPTSNWCAVNGANPEIDKVIAVADNAGTICRSDRGRRRQVGGVGAFKVKSRGIHGHKIIRIPHGLHELYVGGICWRSWCFGSRCCRWQSPAALRSWPRKQTGRRATGSRPCSRRQWLNVCGDSNDEIT